MYLLEDSKKQLEENYANLFSEMGDLCYEHPEKQIDELKTMLKEQIPKIDELFRNIKFSKFKDILIKDNTKSHITRLNYQRIDDTMKNLIQIKKTREKLEKLHSRLSINYQ